MDVLSYSIRLGSALTCPAPVLERVWPSLHSVSLTFSWAHDERSCAYVLSRCFQVGAENQLNLTEQDGSSAERHRDIPGDSKVKPELGLL
jgi:hypothetical protein